MRTGLSDGMDTQEIASTGLIDTFIFVLFRGQTLMPYRRPTREETATYVVDMLKALQELSKPLKDPILTGLLMLGAKAAAAKKSQRK